MTLEFAIFISIFVISSIALDAAFYWRFKNIHDMFYIPSKELTYKKFIFPRLLFVGFSGFLIGFNSYDNNHNTNLIIIGAVLFVIFSMYPHVLIFLRSRRIK
jgi:hypothetical protein